MVLNYVNLHVKTMLSRKSLDFSNIIIVVSRYLLRMGICMENAVGHISFVANIILS